MAQSKKKVETVVCPYCGKEGSVLGMKRWHFDNCKSKPEKEITVTLDKVPKSDLSEAKYIMLIRDNVPKYLLEQLYKLTGNECVICAIDLFMSTRFRVDKQLQLAINTFYKELFNERVSFTTCSSCMRRRLDRIRAYLVEVGVEQ